MSLVKSRVNSRLKQNLSRLKNGLVSRDHQDIYRCDCFMDRRFSSSTRSLVRYTVHDDEGVLAPMQVICPQSRQARKFVRQRLGRGDKAVIGSIDGQPVFYGWLMFSEIEVTYGVFMPLAAHSAFVYNLCTRSSARRQGVMSGFYDMALCYLREHEFRTLYVGIHNRNMPSIKAHEKNGFRKAGYFHTLKVLGICFTVADLPGVKRFLMNGPQ